MYRRHGNDAPHPPPGILHTPTQPPFVRQGHKPPHLWSKSPKPSNKSSSDTRFCVSVRSCRFPNGRRKETLVVQTTNSRVFPAHLDGSARADINIYILGSGAADLTGILGRWSPFFLSVKTFRLSPALYLFFCHRLNYFYNREKHLCSQHRPN